MTDNKDILKQIIPYLNAQGYKDFSGNSKKLEHFTCPICGKNTIHEYSQLDYACTCAACGAIWTVVDLVRANSAEGMEGMTEKQAIDEICRVYGLDHTTYAMQKKVQEYMNYPARFRRLMGLGISEEDAIRLNLFYDENRPYYEGRDSAGNLKVVTTFPALIIATKTALVCYVLGKNKVINKKIITAGVRKAYNFEILKGNDIVFVTKNESDAVAIECCGYRACALGGATEPELRTFYDNIPFEERAAMISVSGCCDNSTKFRLNLGEDVFALFDSDKEQLIQKLSSVSVSSVQIQNEGEPEGTCQPTDSEESEDFKLEGFSLLSSSSYLKEIIMQNPEAMPTGIDCIDKKLGGGFKEHLISISGTKNRAMDFALQTAFTNRDIPIIISSSNYNAVEILSRLYRHITFHDALKISESGDLMDSSTLDKADQRIAGKSLEKLDETLVNFYLCSSRDFEKVYSAAYKAEEKLPLVILEGEAVKLAKKIEQYCAVLIVTEKPFSQAECIVQFIDKYSAEQVGIDAVTVDVFRRFFGNSFQSSCVYTENLAAYA